jgi:hypothetical protein
LSSLNIGEVFLAGFFNQLRSRKLLQRRNVNVAPLLDGLIMLMNDVFARIDLLGNFLGQRERFPFGSQLGFDFGQRRLIAFVVVQSGAEGMGTAGFYAAVGFGFRFRHDDAPIGGGEDEWVSR